ncbi:hypothetical protein SAMN05216386_2455 [Nitrosospira briensis]|uniref:Uncharacterized protein n=1 Tax=Nitrosospira briensis TaxID=35799 RepID=A0A1I5DXQ9_9PROT|nr:hypothetical protein SAMN05216386_2455 [Nitrosospira briensis]
MVKKKALGASYLKIRKHFCENASRSIEMLAAGSRHSIPFSTLFLRARDAWPVILILCALDAARVLFWFPVRALQCGYECKPCADPSKTMEAARGNRSHGSRYQQAGYGFLSEKMLTCAMPSPPIVPRNMPLVLKRIA